MIMLSEDQYEELLRYAQLLAWIMDPLDDADAVRDTAVHVWRIELTPEQHERLATHYTPEFDDD